MIYMKWAWCRVCMAMRNFRSIKEGGKKIWYCKKCGSDL